MHALCADVNGVLYANALTGAFTHARAGRQTDRQTDRQPASHPATQPAIQPGRQADKQTRPKTANAPLFGAILVSKSEFFPVLGAQGSFQAKRLHADADAHRRFERFSRISCATVAFRGGSWSPARTIREKR